MGYFGIINGSGYDPSPSCWPRGQRCHWRWVQDGNHRVTLPKEASAKEDRSERGVCGAGCTVLRLGAVSTHPELSASRKAGVCGRRRERCGDSAVCVDRERSGSIFPHIAERERKRGERENVSVRTSVYMRVECVHTSVCMYICENEHTPTLSVCACVDMRTQNPSQNLPVSVRVCVRMQNY